MMKIVVFCAIFKVCPSLPKLKIKIPSFLGSCEVRLRKACDWISKNDPGRCLTLEENSIKWELQGKESGSSRLRHYEN